MLHALGYPFSGSDILNDLIYVGYLGAMCGIVILVSYLDNRRALRNQATRRSCYELGNTANRAAIYESGRFAAVDQRRLLGRDRQNSVGDERAPTVIYTLARPFYVREAPEDVLAKLGADKSNR